MNRIQLTVIATVVLAFVAGGAVGVLLTSDGGREASRRRRPGGHLADELHLTPEQREQMHKIWSKVMGERGFQQMRKRRLALYRRRTEAIEALLTDQQRVQYNQILADYDRQVEQMDRERRRLTEEAVKRTKEILTEEQVKKYERMRRRGVPGTRPSPGGPPDMPPGPPGPRHKDDRGPEMPEGPADPPEL